MNYDKNLIIKRLNELLIEMGNLSKTYPHLSNTLQVINFYLNKVITEEYTPELDQEIKEALYENVLSNFTNISYTSNKLIREICDLYYNATAIYKLRSKIYYDEDNKSYKIIPPKETEYEQMSLNEKKDEVLEKMYKDITNSLLDKLFNNEGNILSVVGSYNDRMKNKYSTLKETLKEENLEQYYGNETFLKERIYYIKECLEKIISSDKIDENLKQIFTKSYVEYFSIFNNAKGEYYSTNNERKQYLIVENVYKKALEIENNLSIYMEEIWKKYLTKPEDYKEGEEFHFLLHTVTKKHVEEDKLKKVCATLATNKCSPILKYDFGYIMEYDYKQVNSLSCEDSGSWVCTKDEFIERGCPNKWQLAEKINDKEYVFYEYPKISKLILPWDMEEKMVNNNIEEYGEAFSSKAGFYSEIFFNPTNTLLKVIGYFALTDEGMKKISEINSKLENKKPVIDFRHLYDIQFDTGNKTY